MHACVYACMHVCVCLRTCECVVSQHSQVARASTCYLKGCRFNTWSCHFGAVPVSFTQSMYPGVYWGSSQHQWVPGNNQESKCQTAVPVSLMGVGLRPHHCTAPPSRYQPSPRGICQHWLLVPDQCPGTQVFHWVSMTILTAARDFACFACVYVDQICRKSLPQ